MLRQMTVACVIALLAGVLGQPPIASAADIYSSVMTGYTFMGGDSYYQTHRDDVNPTKDYFTATPLNTLLWGSNYWGYAWVDFDDFGTETVDYAELVFTMLGVGAMGDPIPATPEKPGLVDFYTPGDTDVADLAGSVSLRADLKDYLDASSPLFDTLVMPSNGTYTVDITDLYNAWIEGTIPYKGLIFTRPDEDIDDPADAPGTRFASFTNEDGDSPYISTIKHLIPGDANRDDTVDEADAVILSENWLAGVGNPDPESITWGMGDFNRDGQVDGYDAAMLAVNWQNSGTAANSVPEPSALLLLAIGAGVVMLSRKH